MRRCINQGTRCLGALLIACAAGLGASLAAAQAPAGTGDAGDLPRRLEDFGDWRALVAGSGEGRSCYVTQKTVPAPPEGRAKDRPLLYVTHRPGKGTLYVVSYFAGYTVKPGSEIELDFGPTKFRLFTQDGSNSAWSPSTEVDARIIEAMKASWSVTARGTDASGADITETIPLGGFSHALWRASQECQVR